MASVGNARRSPAFSKRFTNFFSKRARWSQPMVQALRRMREDARNNQWEVFLFGGVPRTFWISGPSSRVRDFDLVFEDNAFLEMVDRYGPEITKKNRFGGVKLILNEIEIDSWPLSKTWAFREGHIRDVSFQNLPRTTFLNIDSIAVELAPPPGKLRRLYEFDFFRCLRSEYLDICLEANPFPELCAIRSLRLARTLGFNLSPRLVEYIINAIADIPAVAFAKIQQHHYGRVILDEDDLRDIANRLLDQHSRDLRGGARLFPLVGRQPLLWEVDSFHQPPGSNTRVGQW